MLVFVEIHSYHIFFYKFHILFQGKEGPAKTKLKPVKLRTVLVCTESNSVQCYFVQNPTPCSVSQGGV